MSTFLEICQEVAEKSGTVSGSQPSTITGQSGRLLKIINFVIDAWDEIQTDQDYWNWMRREFTKTIDNPTQLYTPAALSLTDFSRWDTSKALFLYQTSDGIASEGEVTFSEWRDFRDTYLRGTILTQKPAFYSVRPQDNALVFNSIPEVECTIRGEYIKDNQTLAVDADVPECPVKYHKAVRWLALQMLNEHDEAINAAILSERQYSKVYNKLLIDQLEPASIGETAIA